MMRQGARFVDDADLDRVLVPDIVKLYQHTHDLSSGIDFLPEANRTRGKAFPDVEKHLHNSPSSRRRDLSRERYDQGGRCQSKARSGQQRGVPLSEVHRSESRASSGKMHAPGLNKAQRLSLQLEDAERLALAQLDPEDQFDDLDVLVPHPKYASRIASERCSRTASAARLRFGSRPSSVTSSDHTHHPQSRCSSAVASRQGSDSLSIRQRPMSARLPPPSSTPLPPRTAPPNTARAELVPARRETVSASAETGTRTHRACRLPRVSRDLSANHGVRDCAEVTPQRSLGAQAVERGVGAPSHAAADCTVRACTSTHEAKPAALCLA